MSTLRFGDGLNDIDAVLDRVVDRLAEPGYKAAYPNETELELDVWPRAMSLARQLGFDCLTSHTVHSDRAVKEWHAFSREELGPDVRVLGANNRLDIVLRRRGVGSIGIEVKCLGEHRHAAKLTQGLGQSVLGLANRDRTVLLIHCGPASEAERTELRKIGDKVCGGSRFRLVVVP